MLIGFTLKLMGGNIVPVQNQPEFEGYQQTIKIKGFDLDGVFSNFRVNKYSLEYKNVISTVVYDNDG